jgi:hypothetical protein
MTNRTTTLSPIVLLALVSCQHASPGSQRAVRPSPQHADVNQPSVATTTPTTTHTSQFVAFGSAASLREWTTARNNAVQSHARSHANGNMQGSSIGDAFGAGGLGATGTGYGGGGTGEGTLGLGNIGTMGHGAGTGSGQGYGAGAGHLRRSGSEPATPVRPPNATDGDSITNNQVEGIDEGDIVKMHGEHMVILRRGRLFSVRLGGDALEAVSKTNAYGPGQQHGGWYDEMLVSNDTVIVIGYNYRAAATEVGLFDINAQGDLHWRDTMFVRSSDYYSSRNYASRLVGNRLVMYMPLHLGDSSEQALPAVRHSPTDTWRTVVDYNRLYRPVQTLGYDATVHSVMSCDLSGRGFDCSAVGVVGPSSRTFHVSSTGVYLWVGGQNDPWEETTGRPEHTEPESAILYRFPLNCTAPGAARVRGAPLDQFSFDEREGNMHVLLRADGSGDSMWRAEASAGDVGFLSVPLRSFSDDIPTVAASAYKGIAHLTGSLYAMQNRFVAGRVLFGLGAGWDSSHRAGTHLAPLWIYNPSSDTTTEISIPHSVERIEPMDHDALVVGNEGRNLTFSAVALDATPTIASRHTVRGAAQGETPCRAG